MNIELFRNSLSLIITFTLLFAFLIDLLIGDPKTRYHPVMLIGKTISFFKRKLKTNKPRLDKFLGVFLLICVIIIFLLPILLLQVFIWDFFYEIFIKEWQISSFTVILLYSFVMGFLLKWSFALKSLGQATLAIGRSLADENLDNARSQLSLIVRRDTQEIKESHIISAAVECVAESSTDAVTSVIWFYLVGSFIGILIFVFIYDNIYFLLIGIPSAYIFRIINTADSIVGYKDEDNINIGWFSARMDDMSNYIPTRLTVLIMLITGKLLRKDVKNAVEILKSQRNSLESINAGWTMGAMAGLLGIQLEKIGKYKLGFQKHELKIKDIRSSFRIVVLTTIMFSIILSVVVILLINLLVL
ncbi:MAG: adenosylcobinamide-phosphate synthase CbiB [Promethearchaeota archaeon]